MATKGRLPGKGDKGARCLDEEIVRLLESTVSTKGEGFFESVEKLAGQHGDVVYAGLLHTLTCLDFTTDQAREHWRHIRVHSANLDKLIGRETDFRVALLDYFVEINRKIENPIVIEIRLFRQTQEFALLDELTRLPNYRAFKAHLTRETRRAKRYGSALSLIIFDIDDFKRYNDENGHAIGNEALRQVAVLLKKNMRDVDIVCRYGGEEFTLILPETDQSGALTLAERIRIDVAEHRFQNGTRRQSGRLTISGGVATYGANALRDRDLLPLADMALYKAKGEGKNRIEAASSEKRAYFRVDAQFTGSLWIMSVNQTHFIARNVSEGGIFFQTGQALAVGELLRLRFEPASQSAPIDCCARVIRVEESERGDDFEVAAKFIGLNQRERFLLNQLAQHEKPRPKA